MKDRTIERESVYLALDTEREYQDERWGPTEMEGKHSSTEFLAYMQDYLNEALHLVCRVADPEATEQVMHIVRKITTLGVACGEQHGMPIRE